MIDSSRRIPGDWYDGTIPANAFLDETAYVETSYSFLLYRTQAPTGLRMGPGSSAYRGTMFDLGSEAAVSVGEYALLNGAWIICDGRVEIGAYALISWNVVLMDSYRVPQDPAERRQAVHRLASGGIRRLAAPAPARPIRIGRNVWIGFDVCVLPGISIGEGSVIGARSVVAADVPPYTVVAGNPARFVRKLERGESA